jgi:hypothetical protein
MKVQANNNFPNTSHSFTRNRFLCARKTGHTAELHIHINVMICTTHLLKRLVWTCLCLAVTQMWVACWEESRNNYLSSSLLPAVLNSSISASANGSASLATLLLGSKFHTTTSTSSCFESPLLPFDFDIVV